MLAVDLLTRDYGASINGLARYDRELAGYLRTQPGLTLRVHALRSRQTWALRQLQRLSGLDGAAFLGVYPLRLPPMAGDLLHLTTSSHASALIRQPRQPVVITVHDIIHFAYRHDRRLSTYRNPAQRFADRLAIRNLRRASAILASSAFTRQQLIDLAGIKPDTISVVPLGIDLERFRPQPVPATFYRQYGLDSSRPYVLHVSSEEPRKNIETLLRAWPQVVKQHPQALLLKVGRCLYPAERLRSERLIVELGIEASVRFVEEVPDGDLPLFYNCASVCALPSLAEGFGFPVLEALACGTPVVCSTAPALTELVEGIGLQHPATGVEALAAQLLRVLGDPALAESLSQQGLERAAAFDWTRAGRATSQVYARVLGAGRSM